MAAIAGAVAGGLAAWRDASAQDGCFASLRRPIIPLIGREKRTDHRPQTCSHCPPHISGPPFGRAAETVQAFSGEGRTAALTALGRDASRMLV
jgi:hypothetical protein